MKKTGAVIFIIACLVVCLIPSVGMFFKPNAEAIGNEESSALPAAFRIQIRDHHGGCGDTEQGVRRFES